MIAKRTFLTITFLFVIGFTACSDDDGPADPGTEPENRVGIEMVRVEPATFIRGDDLDITAQPKQQVTITKAFWIGKYELLGAEYDKVMGAGMRYHESDRHPVDSITWFDAVEICNRMSTFEGLTLAYTIDGEEVTWDQTANGYRLPTEAEWEMACRAGTSTSIYNGEMPEVLGERPRTHPLLDEIAWYLKTDEGGLSPFPVGGKKPNQFGLYDMLGNLAEWTWDWFGPYENGSLVDPIITRNSNKRISRGGAYLQEPNVIRCGTRNDVRPDAGGAGAGVRIARNID